MDKKLLAILVCPVCKGALEYRADESELVCRADSIPEVIEADIGELEIGDSVKISAIRLPDGVRPSIAERDFTTATVAAPTVMVEEETVEAPEDGEEGEALEGATGEGAADGETQSPPSGGDADQ